MLGFREISLTLSCAECKVPGPLRLPGGYICQTAVLKLIIIKIMTIDENDMQALRRDSDGLLTYEYIANHIDSLDSEDFERLTENMETVDRTGQFLASAARYLHAIDPEAYADTVRRMVAATIDKDREHRYLPDILNSIYGADYAQHAAELSASDNNFRRIYKRLYPNSII